MLYAMLLKVRFLRPDLTLPDASLAVVKVAAAGVPPPITVASIVPPLISGVVRPIESETLPVFILVRAIGYSPIAFAACEAA